MTELPCWALVLLTVVAVLCAALVLAVLLRRHHAGAAPSKTKKAELSRTSGDSDNNTVPVPGAPAEVSPADVEGWVRSHPNTTLLFYAPWCQHCHAMLPNYAEACAQVGNHASLGQVNCDNSPQIVSLYGLRGFPTVLRFVDGEVDKEYQGDRGTASLVDFMTAK